MVGQLLLEWSDVLRFYDAGEQGVEPSIYHFQLAYLTFQLSHPFLNFSHLLLSLTFVQNSFRWHVFWRSSLFLKWLCFGEVYLWISCGTLRRRALVFLCKLTLPSCKVVTQNSSEKQLSRMPDERLSALFQTQQLFMLEWMLTYITTIASFNDVIK